MKKFDPAPGNHVFRTVLSLGLIGLSLFLAVPAADGQLIISEFRVRGPNGANDEFIEIYNNSGADHTVARRRHRVRRRGLGRRGPLRHPQRHGHSRTAGHYLCVNSVGYSLASYPAGNGTTATGDATYTTDIPDNAGIAIFNTSVGANFTLANRLDAVGSTSEANTLYKEGTGYPALTPFSIDYSFYRDNCGKIGLDHDVRPVHDLDPQGHEQQRGRLHLRRHQRHLGRRRAAARCARAGEPVQPDPAQRVVRRRSARPVRGVCLAPEPRPRLHLRPGEQLHLRHARHPPHGHQQHGRQRHAAALAHHRPDDLPRALAASPTCGRARPRPSSSPSTARRAARARATSPCRARRSSSRRRQPNGGGFNSSLSSGTVTLATPLANGASLDLRFLLGIQQTGSFKFFINIEALP